MDEYKQTMGRAGMYIYFAFRIIIGSYLLNQVYKMLNNLKWKPVVAIHINFTS